jgi:UDP-N-acetylglucosamine 1-carboxyvinyltransferase
MYKILIQGGRRLAGEVKISGSKNAALPILISSILTHGMNRYSNVPDLVDIQSTKLLLSELGARVQTEGVNTVLIDAGSLSNHEAPYDLVKKMRASVLVLGPLLARLKKAKVSLPGGCAIGARPINLHLKGFALLGAKIKLKHGYVEVTANKLKGAEIEFNIATVTGTENLMMAAVLADGITVLKNAAREPEIIALADTLSQMGAIIEGAGTSVIRIKGVKSLNPVNISVLPDRIEAGTFMAAAAITNGDIMIKGCEPDHLCSVIDKLKLGGVNIDVGERYVRVRGTGRVKSVDITTRPHPGFPTDMQAQFMSLMCVSKGISIISETIFENRFMHVDELRRMGADITVSGNTATIKGVRELSGAPVMASDLRASASLILAGLIANGTTEVDRVYHLDRGYEAIEKKFAGVGAAIERVNA